jgi:hypothetical protein
MAWHPVFGIAERHVKLTYVFFGMLFGVSLLAAVETSMADRTAIVL